MNKPPQPIDEAARIAQANLLMLKHKEVGINLNTYVEILAHDIRTHTAQAVTAALKRVGEKIKDYKPHRVGMHSDDWGGDSDKPCYCDLHQAIANELSKWEESE